MTKEEECGRNQIYKKDKLKRQSVLSKVQKDILFVSY